MDTKTTAATPVTAEPDMQLARQLFEQLRRDSDELNGSAHGITRDTYGAGEQRAHELMAQTARRLGLEVATDAALNLYMTLPGSDRDAPAMMTGSHLDSVPRGGNYDGAAGVVAGLAVLAGWVAAGRRPRCDVTVMGVRAEESAWFPVSYIGSKSAFGLLDAAALDILRLDTRRSLREHLAECGGRPAGIAAGEAHLKAARIACFLELHIEQGPVLVEAGEQVGVVTGICGSLRYRHARVLGEYAHSGATPRSHRRDAVAALAEVIARLQQDWAQMEAEGHELTLTFGQVYTDAQQADISKVSGLASFGVDIRSRSTDSLQRMERHLLDAVAAAEGKHGVRFELGERTGSQPAQMDAALQDELQTAAQRLQLSHRRLPSGAGHDSALFANQGIATAMLFIRNGNGSHNPDEAMELDDFAAGTRALSQVMAARAGLMEG
ncbi:Zn-dependent hydrolase [Herbaspirillum robiniae]|uniref:Hydantoinase/carbamoylase family amidase n=1 Tax=Herbaspirillum robiniae TaxID=2014887 RepID=A0ABX2M532_9BURK|nr:Zn-dependent hydrolase [Herbaspirillum robiniae]NUU04348.1 hydantoinase/carbamoylase family amidase [Herbaspirillum robiniae]